jgi:hypothetical protein
MSLLCTLMHEQFAKLWKQEYLGASVNSTIVREMFSIMNIYHLEYHWNHSILCMELMCSDGNCTRPERQILWVLFQHYAPSNSNETYNLKVMLQIIRFSYGTSRQGWFQHDIISRHTIGMGVKIIVYIVMHGETSEHIIFRRLLFISSWWNKYAD